MERRGPKLGDAKSLWNFTSSPGWTKEECQILKLCLMKYSVGQWAKIQKSGVLPGKTIQQLNGQTQRLLGQQSLAGCTGLHVDVDRIREHNETRTNVTRKCGLIIYTGVPPTKKMKQQWRADTQAKYGLTKEEIGRACELLEEIEQEKRAHPVGSPEVVSSLMELDASSLDRDGRLGLLIRLRSHLVKMVDLYRKQKQHAVETNTSPPPSSSLSSLDKGKHCSKQKGEDERPKPADAKKTSKAKARSKVAAAEKQAPAKLTTPARDARVLGNTQLQHQEGTGLAPTVASPNPSRKRSIADVLGKKPVDNSLNTKKVVLSCEAAQPSEKASNPRPLKKKRSRSNAKRTGASTCGARLSKKRGANELNPDAVVEDSLSPAEVAFRADVQSIVSMGFSVRLAEDALQESNLSVDRAVEYLLCNCT